MANILNLAGYIFKQQDPAYLVDIQKPLRERAMACQIKGSILLAPEGLNCFIAGEAENLETFLTYLYACLPDTREISFRRSYSNHRPFTRMLVRLKKEIIAFDQSHVVPEKHTVKHLPAAVFKTWYDEKKPMRVLDTRNDYEVALGTFKDAHDLNIKNFKAFPEAVKQQLSSWKKDEPIVMFCTGGVRCEKAGEWMRQAGYQNVYQLSEGILGYFEQCGGEHYQGECFVFDKRVAVSPHLKETATRQCYACRQPMTMAKYQEKSGQCDCGAAVVAPAYAEEK